MFCLNFGVIREAGRMAQSVCCCLCIMMCGGPILLIAGIIILALPNTRKEDVEKYNADGANFNAAPVNKWSGTIAEVNAYTANETVTVESGSSEDVDSFTSVYTTASVFVGYYPSSQVARYRISTVADADPYVSSTLIVNNKTGSVTCQSSGGCDFDQVTSLCRDKYSPAAYAVSSCRKDESCSCTYYIYLNTYCLVATASPVLAHAFLMSTTYKSCYYPFTNTDTQKFSFSQSTTIPFQLRLDTDPFVIMQKITKGDMDFGITIAQQRKIAVSLIAIGCVMIGCIVIIAFILYKVIKAFTDKSGGATQPLNNNNFNQQQQQYGQQQQQYSQPQTPQNFPPYQQEQTNHNIQSQQGV